MATRVPSRFLRTGLDCRPKPSCDPLPPCPACGGLECLCRPRFFAGQLLTEDDLNRLEDYILAKNRLHNRYLIGWGVACGLEVVCSVCEPAKSRSRVIVKPGYALSPCGNDIIVCADQSVDICELIARCRPDTDMCLGPTADDPDCAGGTEEWIFGICYAERPSRGLTALLNQADPSCAVCGCKGCGCSSGSSKGGCGCGGSGGGGKGGCGCAGQGKQKSAKPVPPQCEPTLICEGYSFAVWKAPKKKEQERRWGAAQRRFICCLEPYLTALGQFPQGANNDQLTQWYYDLREAIRQFLLDEGLYDCQLAAKLASAALPSPDQGSVQAAAMELLAIAALVLRKCLCAALLPPCPELANTDCVPLATVTVKRRPCEVVKICNLSARKFLVTIPNLQYWASFFTTFPPSGPAGFIDSLRAALERMCCTEIERGNITGDNPFTGGAVPPAAPAQDAWVADAAGVGGPFGKLVVQALSQPGRAVNAWTFLLGAMGARDAQGKPLVSDFELANPSDFLLAYQVIAPALRAVTPFDPGVLVPAPSDGASLAELTKKVADLQKAVEQLQKDH